MNAIITAVALVVCAGFIASLLLVIASHAFYVPVDERVSEVREILPGANCGGCGFAGCDDYANAVVNDESTSCSACTVGGASCAEQIANILGRAAGGADKQIAQVMCNGTCDASKKILEWQGMQSCAGAKTFFNGNSACSQGCIGLGDCVGVCEFDSIGIIDGVAKVNRDTCVACGKCVVTCPQTIIKMVPYKKEVHVLCMNTEKGGVTRKQCSNGCIGCAKCEKTCKFDAIHVNNNVAAVDYEKCKNCGMCMGVCPTGSINSYNERHAKMAINAKKKAEAEKAAKAAEAKAKAAAQA
ncbi:MAG: RnfABCDGE type electron transport complex subunit B [Mogibacterium diversum]|jgi:electron transport complex protein rnfB|uniref:RnfABCDGE type electron transport complex subunit B n=1 Tax=Mogibacterium diversum TaxID=114527 RepID=UPI001CAE3D54|nr:RnfABCDGE type electron transport complex subunit B [Mogibacterium diversum]MBF1331920.1 RnfABCDGE type electron transport complex subunit B [Mogibacterium diversum]MBF1354824.1 RnfABCDGE type electron transport complex subunit B [Mogibacterium diversum]MBF1357983.1 RnfABCDGE type electron transport complex subunit B [Mogibacterium diversum]MBF1360634.1 RnfABCDGE type electron transport complex subunit B [Mogibacterium diversum]UQF81510.1 MAG: RnfABCDGE type electron transport complex subun